MASMTQVFDGALPIAPARRLSGHERSVLRDLAASADTAPLAGLDDMVDAATWVSRCATPAVSQDTYERVSRRRGTGGLSTAEGRTFRLTLSPGTAQVSCHDAARRDRAVERDRVDPIADGLALYVSEQGSLELNEKKVTRAVTEWSSKSRSRMFRTIPSLDLSEWTKDDGPLAMVTLTLPGEWETLCPTGKDFKHKIELLRMRWIKAGLTWRGLWKLEFQGRGAPHLHALMRVPAVVGTGDAAMPFDGWLARAWASVCGSDALLCHRCTERGIWVGCVCGMRDTERRRHLAAGTGIDFSGNRYSDPRRIATYFLGHSSKHADGKEYQHIVPEKWQGEGAGPGRFWGYWGLKKGTVHIDLDQKEWYAVRRMLRHVARARSWRQQQDAAKYGRQLVRRPLRSLGRRGGLQGGTVVVNDGLALAWDLGRALAVRGEDSGRLGSSDRETRFRQLQEAMTGDASARIGYVKKR